MEFALDIGADHISFLVECGQATVKPVPQHAPGGIVFKTDMQRQLGQGFRVKGNTHLLCPKAGFGAHKIAHDPLINHSRIHPPGQQAAQIGHVIFGRHHLQVAPCDHVVKSIGIAVSQHGAEFERAPGKVLKFLPN